MRRIVSVSVIAWALAAGWTLAAASSSIAAPAPQTAGKPSLQPRTPLLDRPWSADPQKFTFMILGDKTGDGTRFWDVFDRAVDEINLLHPDFVVMVGDMVQGYVRDTTALVQEVNRFREHADRLAVPFFMTAGNHDVYYPEMLDWWRRNYGRTYYSFDHRGCHFLVLNSEETRVGVTPNFTAEQIRWVEADLAAHANARHTFIFLHKPAWQDPSYRAEWPKIEAALGNRPYTVFCGHTHRIEYAMRNGHEYFILGPTGGGLQPSPVKPLGLFHHITHVSFDGDSAYVSFLEPGSIWPRDVATRSFQMAARRAFQVVPVMPVGIGTAQVRTGYAAMVRNGLPDTTTIALSILGAGADGWRRVEGVDSAVVVLAPGESRQIDARFVTSTDRLLAIPRMSATVRYGGRVMSRWQSVLPLFPDSVLRDIPEWEVIGPFDGGTWNFAALPDYRAAFPRMFERVGPDENSPTDGTYRDGGRTLRWQPLAATEGGQVLLHSAFDPTTPIHAFAFCRFAVYSPDARAVYASLSGDDYAQITVNGQFVDGGAVYRESSPSGYVVLPLRAGWNTVLVKSMNNVNGWRFSLRIADPARELRFAARPE